MEEGDDPIRAGRLEVVSEPIGHARRVFLGIEADEVDITVIEGVVFFSAGGKTSTLSVGGEIENAIILFCVAIVVPHGWPDGGVFEQLGEDVEEPVLILGVGSGVIGVIAKHEPDIGGGVSGIVEVGIFDIEDVLSGRAGVANNPDACFGRRAG